jgi:hypothetical protein
MEVQWCLFCKVGKGEKTGEVAGTNFLGFNYCTQQSQIELQRDMVKSLKF